MSVNCTGSMESPFWGRRNVCIAWHCSYMSLGIGTSRGQRTWLLHDTFHAPKNPKYDLCELQNACEAIFVWGEVVNVESKASFIYMPQELKTFWT